MNGSLWLPKQIIAPPHDVKSSQFGQSPVESRIWQMWIAKGKGTTIATYNGSNLPGRNISAPNRHDSEQPRFSVPAQGKLEILWHARSLTPLTKKEPFLLKSSAEKKTSYRRFFSSPDRVPQKKTSLIGIICSNLLSC